MKKEDSLKKRYFYKLGTNIVGALANIVTQAIVPRGLGPKIYGDFSFLTNFFTQFIGFFDMGTAMGFYTKLSQRQKDSGLIKFYVYYNGLVALIVVGLVIFAQFTGSYATIWPGQTAFYIYMAAAWGLFGLAVQILNAITDAYGLTVLSEIMKMCQKILGLAIIMLLFISRCINLTNFFIYYYLLFIFIICSSLYIIKRHGHALGAAVVMGFEQIRRYTKEFYKYANPLFIFSLVGMIVNLLDRWMLQRFGGSVQQGFFGLSFQIGIVCSMFTVAMTPLITREFSIAYGRQDLADMSNIFRRHLPLLYSVAAFFSCFVLVEAGKITHIFGGDSYKGAVIAVAIMALYPIHQTYGQLSDSVFYATEQTALYRNTGIVFMLLGLPITYFLVAPRENMGLNYGATGLAIKMLFLQFLAVNTRLYFNARFLKLSFWKYIAHQVANPLFLVFAALIATFVTDRMIAADRNVIISLLLSAVFYTLITAVTVFSYPRIFGLTSKDREFFKERFIKILRIRQGGRI
jgi:O-antigen/teichoic acid export membrane protein